MNFSSFWLHTKRFLIFTPQVQLHWLKSPRLRNAHTWLMGCWDIFIWWFWKCTGSRISHKKSPRVFQLPEHNGTPSEQIYAVWILCRVGDFVKLSIWRLHLLLAVYMYLYHLMWNMFYNADEFFRFIHHYAHLTQTLNLNPIPSDLPLHVAHTQS